jgi:hypothetical protein
MLAFPDSTFRAVVNPNVDTLYSSAFVDVVGRCKLNAVDP